MNTEANVMQNENDKLSKIGRLKSKKLFFMKPNNFQIRHAYVKARPINSPLGQLMIFINPLSQTSIDTAKSDSPGMGIGPAVASELFKRIFSGKITRNTELPDEYRHLGVMLGLRN